MFRFTPEPVERLRDEKLLNTLFVTTQGAYLSKDGETVTVNVDREVKPRILIHTLGGVD